jgi:hypothetical protein
VFFTCFATSFTISEEASIPLFAHLTSISIQTASIWSATASGARSNVLRTPVVFWAVTEVIEQVPWTPNAAKVLRSAAIPAPPPESEPAIVITTGVLSTGVFSVIVSSF